MQNRISLTLQILLARFDGQVFIPFIPASKAAGFKEQTARNLLSDEKFPIKTVKPGSRRLIHIADLAEYIESSRDKSSKPQRGRPTKASKFKIALQTEVGDL